MSELDKDAEVIAVKCTCQPSDDGWAECPACEEVGERGTVEGRWQDSNAALLAIRELLKDQEDARMCLHFIAQSIDCVDKETQ